MEIRSEKHFKRAYFLDSENGADPLIEGVELLNSDDVLIAFQRNTMSKRAKAALSRACCTVEWVVCSGPMSKDSMDFQIVAELGARLALDNFEAGYILSRDQGYLPALNYLSRSTYGRNHRLKLIPNIMRSIDDELKSAMKTLKIARTEKEVAHALTRLFGEQEVPNVIANLKFVWNRTNSVQTEPWCSTRTASTRSHPLEKNATADAPAIRLKDRSFKPYASDDDDGSTCLQSNYMLTVAGSNHNDAEGSVEPLDFEGDPAQFWESVDAKRRRVIVKAHATPDQQEQTMENSGHSPKTESSTSNQSTEAHVLEIGRPLEVKIDENEKEEGLAHSPFEPETAEKNQDEPVHHGTPVTNLPGIGAALAKRLSNTGIHTSEQMRAIGSSNAWFLIRESDPRFSIHWAYVFEAALQNTTTQNLTKDQKDKITEEINRASCKRQVA